MSIKSSELILNSDGSIYHLNLKPDQISDTIIFVGDQDRVELITKHFDSIEFKTQKREYKTQTGFFKGKRLTVISTGIGQGNIDIVMNELDALVNVNLQTREIKEDKKQLNIIRIGTSGSLHEDIEVDSFLMSTYGLDLGGLLHFYNIESFTHPEIEDAFIQHTNWTEIKSRPILIKNSIDLQNIFDTPSIYKGITVTSPGFYGPQGRQIRLSTIDPKLNSKIDNFSFEGQRITNLEMETAVIYGMAKLLGHKAISLNAILANRANGTFSQDPIRTIENLIEFTLNKLAN